MTNVSNEDFVDQITYDSDRVSRFRRRLIKVEQRLEEVIARLDAMQGNRTGITDNTAFRRPNHEDYIPVDDDGVWQTSATTMNLLYAMYLWADEHGIDNEDDWENHLELHNLQGAKQ